MRVRSISSGIPSNINDIHHTIGIIDTRATINVFQPAPYPRRNQPLHYFTPAKVLASSPETYALLLLPVLSVLLITTTACSPPPFFFASGCRSAQEMQEEITRIRVRMKCRHKPSILQTHHKLLPAHTGVMRCIAQPLRGSTTTKRASDSTNTNRP